MVQGQPDPASPRQSIHVACTPHSPSSQEFSRLVNFRNPHNPPTQKDIQHTCAGVHTPPCALSLSLSLCLIFPCLALWLNIYQISWHMSLFAKEKLFHCSFLGPFFFLQPLAPWERLRISRGGVSRGVSGKARQAREVAGSSQQPQIPESRRCPTRRRCLRPQRSRSLLRRPSRAQLHSPPDSTAHCHCLIV